MGTASGYKRGMLAPLPQRVPRAVEYPDSDGQRMADNTLQYEWIVTIKGGIDSEIPDFVGGDLLWYPVEWHPEIRVAPDVLVALGRPKGHRGSYRQWEEQGVAPQVVFEILSPGNRFPEMQKKLQFYQKYGVQEYYLYDPDGNHLFGWIRQGDRLVEIAEMDGWLSPLLGIRFEDAADKLHIFHKDGTPFLSFAELTAQAREATAQAQEATAQAREAAARAEQAESRAEQAESRIAEERRRAEEAMARVAALEATLRALG